jgi:hypothetical protein
LLSLSAERADANKHQARGGGTGGRSDRDEAAAISSINLSPPSGEKIKAAVEGQKQRKAQRCNPGSIGGLGI